MVAKDEPLLAADPCFGQPLSPSTAADDRAFSLLFQRSEAERRSKKGPFGGVSVRSSVLGVLMETMLASLDSFHYLDLSTSPSTA